MDKVDVVVMSPEPAPLAAAVEFGLRCQRQVEVRVFHIIQPPRQADACRWATIARGRNIGRVQGDSPWLMFVDDDVVLDPWCIRRLVDALRRRTGDGALAADYLGESRFGQPVPHVAMGATLFRREVLRNIRFRWEPGKCECRCCCDDLRKLGLGIGYLAGARARHLLRDTSPVRHPAVEPGVGATIVGATTKPDSGRVVAAFDRNHFAQFRDQFLGSLRAAGNAEQVTAVGYGLEPGEVRALEAQSHVEVVALPGGTVSPAIRRLHEFQDVLRRWAPETPVAYWDAGDVVFQSCLEPLWDLVRQYPAQILAVREPCGYPHNTAIPEWTLSIAGPSARQEAFRLLSRNPFLNSGFAAGTASSLLRYLRYADRLRNTPPVNTTKDWGDQTVFNLYCHGNPETWHEVEEGWNYCLCLRPYWEVYRDKNGRFVSTRETPISVVHGNNKTLSFPRRRVHAF